MINQGTISFDVYEGADSFLGISEVELPSIDFITQNISGSGIGGSYDAVMAGMTNAMSMSLKFRSLEEKAAVLTEPRLHTITLRAAQQAEDNAAGVIKTQSVKHVMRCMPKSYKAGKLAPASANDASGDYSVRYWAMYIDGKKLTEIDPTNFICIINGVDYLADVRKALGR